MRSDSAGAMFESFHDTPIVPPPTYAEPGAGLINSTSAKADEQSARKLNIVGQETSILVRYQRPLILVRVLSTVA